jgi:hypothetical protein
MSKEGFYGPTLKGHTREEDHDLKYMDLYNKRREKEETVGKCLLKKILGFVGQGYGHEEAAMKLIGLFDGGEIEGLDKITEPKKMLYVLDYTFEVFIDGVGHDEFNEECKERILCVFDAAQSILCNALSAKKVSREEILEKELMKIFNLIHQGYDSDQKKAARKFIKLLKEYGIRNLEDAEREGQKKL